MRLEVENIQKEYNEKKVLKGISLQFENGIYALLGPNGAGKSTLMEIILGIRTASSGEVCCDGEDIRTQYLKYLPRVGYLPQDIELIEEFSGEEYLRYMGALKGMPKMELEEQIQELLHDLNLKSERKKRIKNYSGGMKQRIGIAQSILNNPDLIILDEPTVGLDPMERIRFRKMLQRLAKDKIIILSTHIVSDVETMADYIIFIHKGEIIESGTMENLHTKYEKQDGISEIESIYVKLFGEEENQDDKE